MPRGPCEYRATAHMRSRPSLDKNPERHTYRRRKLDLDIPERPRNHARIRHLMVCIGIGSKRHRGYLLGSEKPGADAADVGGVKPSRPSRPSRPSSTRTKKTSRHLNGLRGAFSPSRPTFLYLDLHRDSRRTPSRQVFFFWKLTRQLILDKDGGAQHCRSGGRPLRS